MNEESKKEKVRFHSYQYILFSDIGILLWYVCVYFVVGVGKPYHVLWPRGMPCKHVSSDQTYTGIGSSDVPITFSLSLMCSSAAAAFVHCCVAYVYRRRGRVSPILISLWFKYYVLPRSRSTVLYNNLRKPADILVYSGLPRMFVVFRYNWQSTRLSNTNLHYHGYTN